MSDGRPFHQQLFAHLRDLGEGLPGADTVERGAEVVERRVERGIEMVTERVGGPARVRVVILLAAVLALSAADTGAIAAVAPKLETSLDIGNIQIGLLVTVASLAAAAGMLPVGWFTDRVTRTRMVTVAIGTWGAAEILSALAPDYVFLLIVRVALGALTAVTGPALASLTGDLFPARERSEIYGYILTGELIGAGFGLLVAGLFSAWFTWRVGLAVLALPSFFLAREFHRHLPEPARGGQSRLERGAEDIVSAEDVDDAIREAAARRAAETRLSEPPEQVHRAAEPAAAPPPAAGSASAAPAPDDPPQRDDTRVAEEVRRRHVDPSEGVVLDRDPLQLGWWEAFHYVIAVPSNLTLIIGSALGYFFFGGVETFALIYLEGHYRIGQGSATLIALAVGGAAIVGAIAGGRGTDMLLSRGHLDARFVVPAAAFTVAIVVFAPGVVSTALVISLPLFLVTGFCIGVPNPGLDSARLDVMPSRMWGRGEAVRSFLRSILQAFAPLVFGVVSTLFGGKAAGFGVAGEGSHVAGASVHAAGLEPTFLIMLIALLAAAVIVWRGRKPYPVDVAAAAATERRFPAVPNAAEEASSGDTAPGEVRRIPGNEPDR